MANRKHGLSHPLHGVKTKGRPAATYIPTISVIAKLPSEEMAERELRDYERGLKIRSGRIPNTYSTSRTSATTYTPRLISPAPTPKHASLDWEFFRSATVSWTCVTSYVDYIVQGDGMASIIWTN